MALKNLKITEETHQKLAIFCAKNKYNIGEAADFIIRWAMAQAGLPKKNHTKTT